METLETLAARIETTEDIKSIVRTMKSLSAVSIRQYERAVQALRDYHHTIEHGLQVVLRHRGLPENFAIKGGGRTALIVIGSDRGLCGHFNEGVATLVHEYLSQDGLAAAGANPFILCVGARVAARLETLGYAPHQTYFLPGSVSGLGKTAQSILIEVNRWQETEDVRRIFLAYNRQAEGLYAKPIWTTLIPVPVTYLNRLAMRSWPSRRLPTFTMEAQELFSWLIGQHIYVSLFRAGAESLASEHASRLAAMQAAEHNIDESLDELSREFRIKRQESITTEMLDIISGFEIMRQQADTQ